MIHRLHNLTGSPVKFHGCVWAPEAPAAASKTEEMSGHIRVFHSDAPDNEVLQIPISIQRLGPPTGLPAPRVGHVFLVSQETAHAVHDFTLKRGLPHRQDLWVPGNIDATTGECTSVRYG